MLPKPQEWDQFYAKFKAKSGLDLHLYKATQLQRRIVSMMEQRGAKSLEEFWAGLLAEKDGVVWFQDRLAINVSELFRNPEKYAEMESTILPNLLKQNKSLKIWSAGCSYGAEAHSIAAILCEKFPGNHRIIGTDIDQAALTQARAGEFSDADMKAVPKQYQKYFGRAAKGIVATPQLKKYLQFKTGNLLADRFESSFDLICCRNVVIYFTESAKSELYAKFLAALRPGGVLFVGSTERIFESEKLGYTQALPFFYQKPIEETKTWRNAS